LIEFKGKTRVKKRERHGGGEEPSSIYWTTPKGYLTIEKEAINRETARPTVTNPIIRDTVSLVKLVELMTSCTTGIATAPITIAATIIPIPASIKEVCPLRLIVNTSLQDAVILCKYIKKC